MLPPIVAIAGRSGAGKTTLIEALLPRLAARGIRVGVLKHDAHRLEFDRPGKDTWRAREAGAARVEAFDAHSWFQTAASPTGTSCDLLPPAWREDLDLVLVEGGKGSALDKIWLLAQGQDGPTPEANGIFAVLDRGPDLAARAENALWQWLERAWLERPRAVAVLAGGSSRRMGRPKHAIEVGGRTLIDRSVSAAREFATLVVVAGWPRDGTLPPRGIDVLPDVPGVEGPLGGMLAAMRWDPSRSWIVVACDHPSIRPALFEWLWSERAPGRWIVMGRGRDGSPDPLAAVYEPQSRHLLEAGVRAGRSGPIGIVERHASLHVASPPEALIDALDDADTPADLGMSTTPSTT